MGLKGKDGWDDELTTRHNTTWEVNIQEHTKEGMMENISIDILYLFGHNLFLVFRLFQSCSPTSVFH